MAKRVQDLAREIVERYHGDTAGLWTEGEPTPAHFVDLPGLFGEPLQHLPVVLRLPAEMGLVAGDVLPASAERELGARFKLSRGAVRKVGKGGRG